MGELLWDLFPDKQLLGGSGANVAYHAARLGAEAHLISRVGKDTLGRLALKELTQSGVLTSQISLDPHRPTGTVHVTFEGTEARFQIGKHVAWDRVDPGPDGLALTQQADAVCYGTLVQRTPMMRGRVKQLLRELCASGSAGPLGGRRARRPLSILDLNLRPPYLDQETILDAISMADVVKLNEEEVIWVQDEFRVRDAVEFLLDQFSVRLVAVTRGANGATLFGHQITVNERGILVQGGDPVGAGDSFVAALAIGLSEGRSLPRILSEANRYAAWVASQDGAMPKGPLPLLPPA